MTGAITTSRRAAVRLLPSEPRWAPLLWAWRQEDGARRNMPMRQASVEELAARLAKCGTDVTDRSHDEYRWFIEHEDEMVGTVALKNVSRVNGHAEIGYHVAEAFQGRGIGTQAVTACLDLAFGPAELHRVWATISAHNVASQSLVRKLGFRREARLREHHHIEGRWVDQIVFAILESEWIVR